MATTKDILSKKHIAETEKLFVKEAERLDLLDDYCFVTAYKAYKDQLELMENMLARIQAKLKEEGEANTEIGKFNQLSGQADKWLAKIRLIIKDRKLEKPLPEEADLV